MTKRLKPPSRSLSHTSHEVVMESSAHDLGATGLTEVSSALLVIVRSLARQAAAEMFGASLAADRNQEHSHD
jgi:hypothetical protein